LLFLLIALFFCLLIYSFVCSNSPLLRLYPLVRLDGGAPRVDLAEAAFLLASGVVARVTRPGDEGAFTRRFDTIRAAVARDAALVRPARSGEWALDVPSPPPPHRRTVRSRR
jgi:hypothetical protein